MSSHASSRQVVYDVRAPRWLHFIWLVLTTALTATMIWFVFLKEPESGRADEMDLPSTIAFGFFCLIGLFMIGVFCYRLFANKPYFVLYADGFEYSPGGVSTGLIKWTDVLELREETVLQGAGGFGPQRTPVTAVVLRNPAEYMRTFPAVLQPLLSYRMKMNSSPILITRWEFGHKHVAILEHMREQVARAAGRA